MGKPGRGKHASYEPGEVPSVDDWLASGSGVTEVGHGTGRVLSGTTGELAACLGHLRECASCAAAWPQNIPSGRELIMQLVGADGGTFGPAMAGHVAFALSRLAAAPDLKPLADVMDRDVGELLGVEGRAAVYRQLAAESRPDPQHSFSDAEVEAIREAVEVWIGEGFLVSIPNAGMDSLLFKLGITAKGIYETEIAEALYRGAAAAL